MYFTELFTFHFTNQCHLSLVQSISDYKWAYKEIIRQIKQRTVTRQGSKTGMNYLQHTYLQYHRPSISRLHSHVMADLTRGRMSNPLRNRQQLMSLDFKNNILLCQKTRSCFFQVFPHRSRWNLETHNTYAHTELITIPYNSQTFHKLLWAKHYSYESCININLSLHYFLCCTLRRL
jgi:hypothetical protein